MFNPGVLCRRVCHPSEPMLSTLILLSTIRDRECYRYGRKLASCMDVRDSLDRVDIVGMRSTDAQQWVLAAD